MDRFPGQLVIGGAIMIAGGAVALKEPQAAVLALAGGVVVTVMGLVIGYFAMKAAAEAREGKR